jgi:hypothetical protein
MTEEEISAQNEQILRAYAVCFGSPEGQIVMTDLVPFCRGADNTFVPGDPRMSDFYAGRRDVLLRIQRFSKLTEDEILQLRLGRIQVKAKQEDGQ